jgi:transcriptional regulator with XRE-family HTH domain
MSTFAERVREERIRAGLTQVQLAELAGLAQATISNIESGRNEGSRDLVTLARALKVSAEWLVTRLSEKRIDSGTSSPHVVVTEEAAGRLGKTSGSSTELIGRIQERLDSLRWNWSDLARALGMSEQRLTNWKKRGVPASKARSVELALKLPRFALDVADLRDLGKHAIEHAELLEAWGYLLPAEKQAVMDQIRPLAAHNKAVLEQLQKP